MGNRIACLAGVVVASLLLTGCEAPNSEVVACWRRFKWVQEGMTREQVHALVGKGSQSGDTETWIVGALNRGQRAELTVRYGPEGLVEDMDRHRHGFGVRRLRIIRTEGIIYLQ